jgi:hypothetical protein
VGAYLASKITGVVILQANPLNSSRILIQFGRPTQIGHIIAAAGI